MDTFDFSHAPYRYLNTSEQIALQKAVNIVFFNDGETVIQANQAIEHLYVVIKGLVQEVGADGEMLTLYHPHDTFDTRALMEGGSPHRFVVAEQALLYAIPKETVSQLISSNHRFGAYCYTRIADKLAQLSHRNNESEFESLFTAKVRDAYKADKTLWLDGNTTYFQAAQALKTNKTKSALVRHNEQIGVFTESAFRDMVITGNSPQDSILNSTAFNLISTDIDDFVFNALLRMMHHRIQRVVVLENGEAVGTLEQIDVLAYFSNHSHLVAQRLERAQTIDDLVDISGQMTRSIELLRSNGVRAPQLAQLMQVLNTSLFEKAWRLIASPQLYEQSCLIVMGSEGRGEQILKTDQDNALILHPNADPAEAQAAAEQFSATLARLGYPPCSGNIMVNNPMWRKNVDDFKQMAFSWIRSATPDNMMYLAIFCDAKAVAGDVTLLADVKAHLQQYLSHDSGMLMAFARAVDMFDDHRSGFFTQLLKRNQQEKLDIKKIGQFPIVHGVRALALELRLEENNTFERIQKLVQHHIINEDFAKDLSEALSYLMDLRLQTNLALFRGGSGKPNQLDYGKLTALERELLKDALKVVKQFKQIVRYHFHIST